MHQPRSVLTLKNDFLCIRRNFSYPFNERLEVANCSIRTLQLQMVLTCTCIWVRKAWSPHNDTLTELTVTNLNRESHSSRLYATWVKSSAQMSMSYYSACKAHAYT